MLTLHQLEVFIAVADEMSVGRAAERLHVTQPAVSAAIAALEREFGIKAFARNGRGVMLTPAGEELRRYAASIVGLVGEAVAAAQAVENRQRRAIRIGATSSLVSHVLAPILAELKREKPDHSFELAVGNRTQVWQHLDSHAVDVALSAQPPSIEPFFSVATMPNDFVLVARPGVVWAGRLQDVTWLIREEGATSRGATDEVLTRLAIDPATMVIGSDAAILASVEAGLGVGLLPQAVVTQALTRRSAVALHSPATPFSMPWHLAVRRAEVRHSWIREFLADVVRLDRRFQWTPAGRKAMGLTVG